MNIFKKGLIIGLALLSSVTLFGGCSKNENKTAAADDDQKELPIYSTEYDQGRLMVTINDEKSISELVVPVCEDGGFVSVCNSKGSAGAACSYSKWFENVPCLILAEDFEDNILSRLESSDLSDYEKRKITVYYTILDPDDKSLSDKAKQRILEGWPITEYAAIYAFDNVAEEIEVKSVSELLDKVGYTKEDCLSDLENLRDIAKKNKVSIDTVHPSERGATDLFTVITFSEGIEYIDDICPYEYENVETINIPASVKDIDVYAFDDLEKLETINFGGTEEQWLDMFEVIDYDRPELYYIDDLNLSRDVTVKCTDKDYLIEAAEE